MRSQFLGQAVNSIDEMGVHGSILHYAMVLFFVASAFLIFVHLWRLGRLDMDEEPKIQMMKEERRSMTVDSEEEQKQKEAHLKSLGELDTYGNTGIMEGDAKIPRWLLLTYVVLPIWGIISLTLYWNGSHGWLDRGYWQQLQRAANTTFPSENFDDPQEIKKKNLNKNSEDNF